MTEAGQPVSRALHCARELEYGQRCRQAEVAAQDQRRDRAFGASAMCSTSVRRPTAASASSESERWPSGTSIAASVPAAAASVPAIATAQSFDERRQRRLGPDGQERGDESRLLELVDGFLDPVHELLDRGAAPNRATSLRASMAILSAFSSMRRARAARPSPST